MPGTTADESLERTGHISQPSLPRRWRWFAHALLLVSVCTTWGWLIWRVVIPALQENTWPYSAYWIVPRLALEGRADLVYTDSSVYMQEIARLNVSGDMLEVNMPTTLLPFLPLALLPISDAFRAWTVMSLACFALGWLALLRTVRLPVGLALLLTAAVPLFEPFSHNIRGQVYLALFSLTTLSAILSVNTAASPNRRQVVGGVLLGLAAVLKLYYGLVLALPVIVKRRWRFLASTGLVTGAAVFVTVWAWGTGVWERAIYLSLTWRERPETIHTAYQTTNSLIGRLFRFDELWNPAPVANLPWLVEALWWLVTLATVGVTVLALWRSSRQQTVSPLSTSAWHLLAFAVMVPLASALAPIAESYHYVLCLFPIVVVVGILYESWAAKLRMDKRQEHVFPLNLLLVSAGFVLAVVLLGMPWKYNVLRVDGWSNLLHYPRLYGALILWLLMVILLIRPTVIGSVAKGKTGVTSQAVP